MKSRFKIEDSWAPTKIYELDSWMLELIETAKKLSPGQSIPLNVGELKERYGWKTPPGCCSGIRHAMKKKISDRFMGKISFHEVKDANGKITQIRIRHKNA